MTRLRRDAGLTLVELVVTVTLVGIVTAALAGSITVFVRTQDDPTSRVDRSRGLQQLVNYLPADVASAQVIEVNAPWTSPCLTVGTPVLNLAWSESFPDSTLATVSVTYVRTPSGSQLERNVCEGGAPQVLTMARDISDVAASVGADVPGQVDVVLNYDGLTETISASSRNR